MADEPWSRLVRRCRSAGAILLATVALGLLAGCEGGGGGGSDNDNDTGSQTANREDLEAVVGTWSMTRPGRTVYILFRADGTWTMYENADGTEPIVYGTYTVEGNTIRGPMNNPGVGTGEIYAIVDGDTMMLDFIEHWHTPYKTVDYTGARL